MGERLIDIQGLEKPEQINRYINRKVLLGIATFFVVSPIVLANIHNKVAEIYNNRNGGLDGINLHSESIKIDGCRNVYDRFIDFTKGLPIIKTRISKSCE